MVKIAKEKRPKEKNTADREKEKWREWNWEQQSFQNASDKMMQSVSQESVRAAQPDKDRTNPGRAHCAGRTVVGEIEKEREMDGGGWDRERDGHV